MPSPSFELTSAQRSAFRAALNEFDAPTVHRGRQYFLDGRVRSVAPMKGDPGGGFVARVQGTTSYQVEWIWQRGNSSWDHECTCPVGYACKHSYAVAQVLLRRSENPVSSAPAFGERGSPGRAAGAAKG